MAHTQRYQSVDAFSVHDDFAAQMHDALRKSPWWMISIVFHVVLALGLSAFRTEVVRPVKPEAIAVTTSKEEPLDVEKPPEEPTEAILPDEPLSKDPDIKEEVAAVTPADDNDMDFHENAGPEDTGDANAPFQGPQSNNLLGPGGGAGGWKRGKGNLVDRSGRGRPGEPKDVAVLEALRWLAAHQSEDGGWEAAGFDTWCDGKINTGERPDGHGKAMYDTGVTGLALCAFLGAGYTNRGEHEFAKVVRRGLAYLKCAQDAEGCFGPRSTQHYIYNHATAALAMVEAYGMTESPIYKASAQRALDFLALARNPYFVWRYGVKPGDNDTSVTGWMMMALKSARLINEDAVRRGKKAALTIDEDAFEGIRAWIDKMTDPDYGRVGYVQRGQGAARPQELVDRFPADKTESMTAVGLLARIFLGEDPRKSDAIRKGVALCTKLLPVWSTSDGSIDMYYWYYASLAMFQVGGQAWKDWDKGLSAAIVPSQRRDGSYCGFKGSWDPIDPWGGDGGRVYSTAMLCMCLEVLYRYELVPGTR